MKKKLQGNMVGREIIEQGVDGDGNGYIRLDNGRAVYVDDIELEEIE